ncbi:hypothetical protein [Streptomyces sp. DSM 40484]|uniref:hypothetical protein n=1 Tax=Streptomyces kroppenstedtii TaxID=3051181 RepID=UPI0028D0074A|nr:hypothetical protein [Streptomyces sp. DSM 40484]
MKENQAESVRLLPWAGEGGKPCYLVGDGTGALSRVADRVESVQLGMSVGLLDHAADLLSDERVTAEQLRFLAGRLTEALTDVHRIAVSRGRASRERPHDDGRRSCRCRAALTEEG